MLTVFQSVDIAVPRHPESFAAILDATNAGRSKRIRPGAAPCAGAIAAGCSSSSPHPFPPPPVGWRRGDFLQGVAHGPK